MCIAALSYAQEYRVGISLDDTLAKRWVLEKKLLVEEIKKHGGKPILKISGGDPVKQKEQAYELIKNKKLTTLIIVANDGESMSEVVNYAHSKGIETIAYDRMIPNADLDVYVSFDNVMVGRLMAESMLEKYPKGNYMMISGPKKDKNSLLLKEGQMQALQPEMDKGNINLVYEEHTTEWLDAAAFQKVFDFTLMNPDTQIDVLLAANDNMAAGALEALDLSGMEGVAVAGQDAEESAIERIKQGRQALTIRKSVEKLALLASILATHSDEEEIKNFPLKITTIDNGKKEVKSYLLLPEVVSSETLQDQ